MAENKAGPRTFTQWLQEQRKGNLHGELTEALAEVSSAVVEHEQAGKITLTIDVKPTKDDARPTVLISDKVVTKIPQPVPRPSMFFPDENGHLHRSDPNQPELDGLKALDGEAVAS